MEDPRRVLARYGLHAKKSWGQNFLVDRSVYERIVRAAALGPDDVVVEIGAGLGTLTQALAAASARKVIAVEREPDMLAVLAQELVGEPRVEIRAVDAAAFDFAAEATAAGRPVVVVGNLPYQLSSALMFAFADAAGALARAIVMVQREFAERVVAPPGSKTYGRLSVMIQQRVAVRSLFHVRPGSFHPPPSVTSTVLSLEPRAAPLAPVRDAELFSRVVKEAFAMRRKMLRRALEPGFGAERVTAALARADVDGERRAETLSVEDFARLADAFT